MYAVSAYRSIDSTKETVQGITYVCTSTERIFDSRLAAHVQEIIFGKKTFKICL